MAIYSESPFSSLALVTKATADLPGGICRGLLVGTAGDLDIMDASGNVLANVPVQQGFNPIAVRQVRATGNSTAANIWAGY